MSSVQAAEPQRIAEFIGALEHLDAGGRARLRRNAGRTLAESRNVYRVFFQTVPYGTPRWAEEDYFLVATLFPLVHHQPGAGSLGHTLYRVRNRNSSARANSLDHRFQTLLDSNREQLTFRLRQVVRLIASSELRIDWAELLNHALAWESEARWVQLRWARDYYAHGDRFADVPVESDKNS